MNLALIPESKSSQLSADGKNKGTVTHPINVTMSTPALRARLECSSIPEIANASSWIVHHIKKYVSQYMSSDLPKGFGSHYMFDNLIFANSPSNTSVFANKNLIDCCVNGTNDDPQTAVLGYFSPLDVDNFFHANSSWPRPFITKWIVGKSYQPMDSTKSKTDSSAERLLLFEQIPPLQAARCMPIIETANSTVTVDKSTGMVHSRNITSPVAPAFSAWSDAFVAHNLQNSSQQYHSNYTGPRNLTTSYGVLFMNSMFNAADTWLSSTRYGEGEPFFDKAFVIRDQDRGLNMDLMTYSMYSLANKNPEALLDYSTLVKYADRTFQTFFQHFIRTDMSLTEGGFAYQKISDKSKEDMEPPIYANGAVLSQ